MKDKKRKESARVRAEAYAPAPQDSRLLYGVIAVSLLLMAVAAAGAFYAVDLWRQPLVILALILLASGAGLVVRRFRMSRHRTAHRVEYDRSSEDASGENQPLGHVARGSPE